MGVVLSYSRRDSEFVDLLYRLLESKGYDVWMDRDDIEAGSRWDVSIEAAVDARSHLVVVMSPDAVESPNVADEWSYALEENKTVIPLYYRECKVPMRLRRVQWVDFAGKEFAHAFGDLLEALGAPDRRPGDRIQLAKREGLIFVDTSGMKGLEALAAPEAAMIRIALNYSEYPTVLAFLQVIWFTLLWGVAKPHTYGERWCLQDRQTGHIYELPPEVDKDDVLLHEIGIEPGAQLRVILAG